MWLRDAALQGYLIPIRTSWSTSGDIRVYRFGQSIWEYVARRYGEEKVGGHPAQSRPRSGRAPRAVEYVLGDHPGEALRRLAGECPRSPTCRRSPAFARSADFGRRLTRHEKDGSNLNVVPALSPTGDKLSFISDRELDRSLYLGSAIDGRVLGRLAEGERRADFESFRFFTSSADWSPDGRRLAVPAKAGPRDVLYLFDMARRKVDRRLEFDGVDVITSPCWSPDGAQIAFSGERGGQSDLYVVTPTVTNLVRLTSDRYADRQPRWSPDGKRLAFVTDRGEGTDLDRLVFARDRSPSSTWRAGA